MVNKWIENVREERGNDVIIMLIGNKTNLASKRSLAMANSSWTSLTINFSVLSCSDR